MCCRYLLPFSRLPLRSAVRFSRFQLPAVRFSRFQLPAVQVRIQSGVRCCYSFRRFAVVFRAGPKLLRLVLSLPAALLSSSPSSSDLRSAVRCCRFQLPAVQVHSAVVIPFAGSLCLQVSKFQLSAGLLKVQFESASFYIYCDMETSVGEHIENSGSSYGGETQSDDCMNVVACEPNQPFDSECTPVTDVGTASASVGKENMEKKGKRKRSEVWEHFTLIKTNDKKGNLIEKWKCNHCGKTYKYQKSASTTNCVRHIQSCSALIQLKRKQKYFNPERMNTLQSLEEGGGSMIIPSAYDSQRVKTILAKLIITAELPFSIVEHPYFNIGRGNSMLAGFDDFLNFETETDTMKSELEIYLSENPIKQHLESAFDILDWWKLSSMKLPTLSNMARDVLTIPITTVASESAFSAGGRVLDDYRSALSPQSVNALICTSNWLRGQFTHNKDVMTNTFSFVLINYLSLLTIYSFCFIVEINNALLKEDLITMITPDVHASSSVN